MNLYDTTNCKDIQRRARALNYYRITVESWRVNSSRFIEFNILITSI